MKRIAASVYIRNKKVAARVAAKLGTKMTEREVGAVVVLPDVTTVDGALDLLDKTGLHPSRVAAVSISSYEA